MAPKARVLVIEDNPLVREVLRLELAEAAYDVQTVADGPSGIAVAREDPPDVVVLDFRMPGMDGTQVLRALKELRPDLPVFFYTVYGDFAKPALAEADGAFVKAADLTPLFEALGRATGRDAAQ